MKPQKPFSFARKTDSHHRCVRDKILRTITKKLTTKRIDWSRFQRKNVYSFSVSMTVKPKVFESMKPKSLVHACFGFKTSTNSFCVSLFHLGILKQNQRLAVTCGVITQQFKRRLVKKLTKGSLRRIVYIVEEELMQLIFFSHWKCQEAAICGDSLVASLVKNSSNPLTTLNPTVKRDG